MHGRTDGRPEIINLSPSIFAELSRPRLSKVRPLQTDRQTDAIENITTHSQKIMIQLENVAIANALQLEAARRHASPFRFNYDAMPSL